MLELQRKLRDITADIYIAERLGWPAGVPPDTKSVWEIAFTGAGYIDVGSQEAGSLEVQEPMRIWVKIPVCDLKLLSIRRVIDLIHPTYYYRET